MRWSRRRHKRARRQLRRLVEQYEQAMFDDDYTARTRLEKLIPLQEFCRKVTSGSWELRQLPPTLRRRVLGAVVHGMRRDA